MGSPPPSPTQQSKGKAGQDKGKKVRFMPVPFYGVVPMQSVLARQCIVPDYARGEGSFLVNDLVRSPSPDMVPIVPEAVVEDELAELKQQKMALLASIMRRRGQQGQEVKQRSQEQQQQQQERVAALNQLYHYDDDDYHCENGPAGSTRSWRVTC
jgi:hypothetical protein